MKRLAARYFSEQEIYLKESPEAKAFDSVLTRLDKLHVIGDFRNKYVMSSKENQHTILDRQLRPFEKARKIIAAAYQHAGIEMPSWLKTEQIEITGLQESIVDNKEAVLVAFESMIIDKFRALKGIIELTNGYKDATTRFKHLAQNELLPFAHILKTHGGFETDSIIINTGILGELWKYGISKEQLPTLKALADYMTCQYRQSHGKWVIAVTTSQLEAYFVRHILLGQQPKKKIRRVGA